MKQRKLLLVLAMLLLAALVLAACGGSSENNTGNTANTGNSGDAGNASDAGDTSDAGDAGDTGGEPAYVEIPYEEPMVLSAGSCDYGGKVLSIEAVDELTVKFTLCKPDPAFIAKMAFSVFAIQPREWVEYATVNGEILEKPIGTGPYALDSWNRGDSIIFKRFDNYWGTPAPSETLVMRWSTESAARLLELQSGTADYMTYLGAEDFEVVENDPNLQIIPVETPNILYIAFTNTFAPFDNVDVRKAVALGIDRSRIVENFYPVGSEVASHFTPCSIPNGCEGESWHDFDPDAARTMLADAGFPDGFETTIYYRDVYRSYLPEPGAVAVELQTQLQENLGITANVVVMESGEFIDESTNGRLDGIYLLGWGADYPHVTNFLDYHFAANNPQYGEPHPEVYEPLYTASSMSDLAEAAPYYEAANNALKELVPMIPVVHSATANAALVSVENANNPPFGAPKFAVMNNGKDTIVEMKSAEPISLFCADESDGESLEACEQILDGLYNYNAEGVAEPALATECVANEDSTVYTCYLREGVTFHDGSAFDANDVVATWTAGLDASSPTHNGNTNSWTYYDYLWDGLMNVPAE